MDETGDGLTEYPEPVSPQHLTDQNLTNHSHFLELPTEMILRICDFLDSDTVINVLGKVCQLLALMVADDLIWKTRIHKRWPGKRYPPAGSGHHFNWRAACIERENEYRKWSCHSMHMNRINIQFDYCVDVVHITKSDYLVLGLRDHTLYNFKLSDIPLAAASQDESSTPVSKIADKKVFEELVHQGWIWTISSDEDRICSGAWDSQLILREYSGRQISSYKCASAVLCSAMDGGEILAGTFDKTLVKVDTRIDKPVATVKVHARAVLCLQQTPNWIITGSESKVINIIDRRTLKIHNAVRLPFGYPRSLSLQGPLMYVGSQTGAIHIFSFDEALGRLDFIETFEGTHEGEVRSVRQTLGSVLTASKDGTCKVWEPSTNPSAITTLKPSATNVEICSMDYKNGSVVLGTANGIVSLYRPTPQ